MAKVLRTAALVVGAVALVATGVGAVGAIAAGTSIAAGIAGASIAGISAATLGFAATVLGLGASLLAKKPSASITGSPESFAADPKGLIPYLIGRAAISGNIVFRRAWDSASKGDNDRQAFVVILSGAGPIESIESFSVDNVTTTFDTSGQATGTYADFMWQTTALGACPESAPIGFGTGAGTPPGWTSAHKLSGYAKATWTLRFDTKAKHYQNGVPKPQWVAKGVKVYDPRLDSTYPGGSGPQRANDETTWAWGENPYLHGLAWVIGRHQNGQRVFGIGAPLAGIDVAAFVEGANIADVNGWKVGGVVYSGDSKWDTLKKMLQAGMGEPLALGAKISCFVNAPRVSLATITVGDIVGDASVTATQPRRDRINTVVPSYTQPANQWQFLPGTPVTVDAYVTADGGKRSKEIPYPLIQVDAQAAVAARYDIENAREFGPISLPLKPRWIGYKPGDCVTANVPELGLNAQPILLLNRDLDPGTAVPTFTARSETAGKHAFALGQVSVPPPTPSVTGAPAVPAPASADWSLAGVTFTDNGVSIPALVITGTVANPGADAVVFEFRVAGATNWTAAGIESVDVIRKEITGVTPGTSYEAAVSYRVRGIVGARLALGPVTAGSLSISSGEPLVSNFSADGAAGAANITWRNPSVSFDHLVLYRGTTSAFGSATAIASGIVGGLGQVMTFDNTGLSPGTYYYWLRAFDAAGTPYTAIGPDSAIVT